MLPHKIRERKIVQWGLAYVAGAWAMIQLAEFLWGLYGWPPGILRAIPIFAVIGLLTVLVLAWFHGEKGRQRAGGIELAMLTGIMVLAGGVFYMLRKDAMTAVVDVAAADPLAAEQGSIAVLPFADMSPAKDQTYFSDGLSEELLNVLAQIPELRVAARTSSFSFRDSNASIDSIARTLRVEYVLEGSVRTIGERVRITAQLIKAGTGSHVWSNTYDRDLKDVFAVQEEISRAIVNALRLQIGGRASGALALTGTSDPEAHGLVLRGVFEQNKKTAEGIREAVRLFERAIERDPNYARAHALAGYAYHYIAYRRFGPVDENYRRANEAARKALALDPKSAEAHIVLGRVKDIHEWDFKGAEEHFARAVELNPGLADAYNFRAWLLMRLGRTEESLAAAERGVLLDPVSIPAQNTLATMYSYARDYPRSMAVYREALNLSPGNPIVLGNMALTAGISGKYDEALRYMDQAAGVEDNDPFVLATLGFIYGRTGRTADAQEKLRQLRAIENASPYLIAMVHTSVGDKEAAFRELERAYQQHDDYMPDLGVDDVFDPLRGDPRMARLLERVGLPAATPIT